MSVHPDLKFQGSNQQVFEHTSEIPAEVKYKQLWIGGVYKPEQEWAYINNCPHCRQPGDLIDNRKIMA